LAFIRRITLPVKITRPLKLLQGRREGIGFEKQLLARTADGLIVFLPQRYDRDVLRVGETEFIEDRLVGPAAGEIGRIDRKAGRTRSWSW
jgi:hypothetical protein